MMLPIPHPLPWGKRLPGPVAIAVAMLTVPAALPAQQAGEARTGIVRAERALEGRHSLVPVTRRGGTDAGQRGHARPFRPIGTLVGALLGASYGGLVYVAASEAGDDIISFSDHRFPKAVAVGAVAGVIVDLARCYGSRGVSRVQR